MVRSYILREIAINVSEELMVKLYILREFVINVSEDLMVRYILRGIVMNFSEDLMVRSDTDMCHPIQAFSRSMSAPVGIDPDSSLTFKYQR